MSKIRLPGRGIERTLHCQVLQSPLAGVTDQIFRGFVRRWAPNALLFTEMVNATSLELGHGRKKVEELTKETGPIGVQLFDYRPNAMAEAAKRAEGAGAFLIDLNMGCPVRKIASKGGGSGLIREPNLASQIVRTVAKAVQIPITVKTRLGWCANTSDPVNFALMLQEAGAQMITLHGRTREQGFDGKADWGAIAKVKRALTIPLIANGDIRSVQEAFSCLDLTGADGIMIGRGSLGAPWLVGQIDSALNRHPFIETPSPRSRLMLAREHLEALLALKGDHGLLIARKHMSWSCKDFPGSSQFRHLLMRATTPNEALALLEKQINKMN